MSLYFPSCVEVTSLTDGPWFPVRYARLKELEVREEMLNVVADLVMLDKVQSQLWMLIHVLPRIPRCARGSPRYVPLFSN